MYYLEIAAAFCDLNFEKITLFFGLIFFHLKSGCVKFWKFRMSVRYSWPGLAWDY